MRKTNVNESTPGSSREEKRKKPYQPPRLVCLGDVRDLTRADVSILVP